MAEKVLAGLAAGAAGTAAMTAVQEPAAGRRRTRGAGERAGGLGAGARACPGGERVVELVTGLEVPAERIPLLTQLGHWLYGTSLGAVYGLAGDGSRPVRSGLAFGGVVWAASTRSSSRSGPTSCRGATR